MRRPVQSVLLSVSLLSLAVSLGCGSDTTGPTSIAPAHLYFQLTLNHHVITMALTAPYNTLQLVATPRSATGMPLADTGTTTYTVLLGNDNCGCQSVTVNPTGLLTADSVDGNVEIIAHHTVGTVTKTDSAFVNVNDVNPVPVFTTLALQPLPGDSAFHSVNEQNPGVLSLTVLDANSKQIDNVLAYVTTTNGKVFDRNNEPFYNDFFKQVFLSPDNPGRSFIRVEATVYGVSLTDSLLYTVGWPLISGVTVNPVTPVGSLTPLGVFSPHNDTVAVGATVFWINQMQGQSADVVFDTPATVRGVDSATTTVYVIPSQGGGNIPAFAAMDSTQGQDTMGVRARSFPVAGTYNYHSALYGTTGVLHVLPEFQVP